MPALKATGPVTFIIGTWIIYWTGWAVDWEIMAAMLAGLALYAFFSWRMPKQINRPSWTSVKASVWLVVYLAGLLTLSYFGSHRFGSPYQHHRGLIHFPWDLAATAAFAVACYYWGVASGYPTEHLAEAIRSASE